MAVRISRRSISLGLAASAALPLSGLKTHAVETDDYHVAPAGTAPFSVEVYQERRLRLMEQLKGGVAVIFGADSLANGRQNPDFAYLTGLTEERGAALVLAPGERTYREFLFLSPRDQEIDRWEGERLPLGSVLERRTGILRVRRIGALGPTLTQLASRARELHFLGPVALPDAPNSKALELYGRIVARLPGTAIRDKHDLLPSMRSVKEPRELELMRKAVAATEYGLASGMRKARMGMREYELKDTIEAGLREAGARRLAFTTIVGSGRHGATLHYTGGDRVIQAGDLVVCDVGAEFSYYAADITRTFPISKRFADEQKEVYEIVLRAQQAASEKLRAGAYHEDLQKAAEEVIEAAGFQDDFRHGIGHFVGLAVHDTGDYDKPLPTGAVVTIEPGIYLAERGFGIRIEDEFIVTNSGCELLSSGVPRTVGEIEKFLAG